MIATISPQTPLSPERILSSCEIANALADGGDKTKAIAVPVPASSGYPPPTSQ
jgi:hypothetical protein